MNVIIILLIVAVNPNSIENFLIIVKHAMKFMKIVNVIWDMEICFMFQCFKCNETLRIVRKREFYT